MGALDYWTAGSNADLLPEGHHHRHHRSTCNIPSGGPRAAWPATLCCQDSNADHVPVIYVFIKISGGGAKVPVPPFRSGSVLHQGWPVMTAGNTEFRQKNLVISVFTSSKHANSKSGPFFLLHSFHISTLKNSYGGFYRSGDIYSFMYILNVCLHLEGKWICVQAAVCVHVRACLRVSWDRWVIAPVLKAGPCVTCSPDCSPDYLPYASWRVEGRTKWEQYANVKAPFL